MNKFMYLNMAFKNKQITIRIPMNLETKIKNKAWQERVSLNKVIENILLRAFELPQELPPIMSNVIWNKLNDLEVKLEQTHKLVSKIPN